MSALMRPGGLIRPSPIARRQGLVFALDFSAPDALPWLGAGQGSANGAFTGGSARTTTRRGWGMTGTNGYWRVPIGTAGFSLPTTQGTVLFHAVSATASYDGTFPRRYMWAFGRGDAGWPNSPWCGMTDFDGSIIGGWVGGGVDGRLSVSSASGAAWPANSTPLIGFSYGSGGQSLYYNGAFAGSNSFNNFGDTSAQYLSVGDGELNIWWNRSDGDAILYLLVFDREFSQGEHARAARDPWWWVDRPARALQKEAAAPSIGLGLFDPDLVPIAWFTPHMAPLAWFDREMVGPLSISAGGNVTVSLAGAAIASAAGALTPNRSLALSGQALSSQAGTVVAAMSFAIAGAAVTSAIGSVALLRAAALSGAAASGSAGSVVAGVSVAASGASVSGSAGSLAYGTTLTLSGIGSASGAGSVAIGGGPVDAAVTGEGMTISLGMVGVEVSVPASGASATSAAGSVLYATRIRLTGVGSGAALGAITGSGFDTVAALTGIHMTLEPGNVRVSGGTRFTASQGQAVAVPSLVGNTMPPPPRLTGNVEADIRAQQQYLQTFYDQFVKVNNVLGRINDHETRIAALEADDP
jgi:hypothetical protein